MAKLKNYKYRKYLTVVHSNDGALSNYQLNLIVNRTTGTDGESSYFGTDGTLYGQPDVLTIQGNDVPVYPYTHPAYNSFLNTYGVWTNTDFQSPVGSWTTVNYTTTVPDSSQYRLVCSADNHIRVVINGVTVGSNDDWGSTNTSYVNLTAGSLTVTCSALNDGGPASFAAALYHSNGTNIWNTRSTTVSVVNEPHNVTYVSTKCKPDYSDLRFTKVDGTTLLDYWIESYNSSTASVWVEFDTIPAAGDIRFYMYYGYANATSLSNIDTTMFSGLRYFYYQTSPSGAPPTSYTYRGNGIDTSIYHNWQSPSPISINSYSWEIYNPASLKYIGWIKNRGSGNHIIYCAADDGQRLYIPNTSLIIDNWVEQGVTEKYASKIFSSPVRVKYDYYSNALGPEDVRLGWAPADASGKVYPIPATYLRCANYTTNAPVFGDWGPEERLTTRKIIF